MGEQRPRPISRTATAETPPFTAFTAFTGPVVRTAQEAAE